MGVGVLAACSPVATSTPTGSPSPSAPLPAGISVSAYQNRDDYGPRRLELAVENSGTRDITITRATYSSPHFTTDAAWTRRTEIPSGSTRDLRVELGPTRCSTPGSAADAVTLHYTLPDGTSGVTTLTPTIRFRAVDLIVGQDCAEQLTADHVAISLAGGLRTTVRKGHPIALLDITFAPTDAEGSVTLSRIDRTILLRPADNTDTWPLDLTIAAGSEPVTKTLEIVPANCRLHTVTEDKRGTFFPLTVTPSGASEGLFYLASTSAMKEAFYDYIADYCGWDASTPLD